MSDKALNRNSKSWIYFFLALLVCLIYGLLIRDKGLDTHSSGALDNTDIPFSDPLPIRDTNIEPSQLVFDAEVAVLDKRSGLQHVKVHKREVVLMGSQFVFMVEASEVQALAAISQSANAVKNLERNLSSWIPSSDISRLNERAGRGAVTVSPETFALLKIAQDISLETLGAFDVTVGAVWDIWPFRNRMAALPSQELIDEHLKLVDAKSIVFDEASLSVSLPKKGMKVNLGAVGKGYAASIAIETMKSLGIEHAAVSAGGDLYFLGTKNNTPWVVDLEHPRWPGRSLDRFSASNIAVATSGDAKQFIKHSGKRFGHIIDPRTGWPVDTCQSVTIVTSSSTKADAYATAVYVMGPKEGMNWVESQENTEVLIVDKDGRIYRSSGWADIANKTRRNGFVAKNTKDKNSIDQSVRK